jgi:hypothetical protein
MQWVLRHLQRCRYCERKLEIRDLKKRLKVAIRSQTVPPDLMNQIIDRIRAEADPVTSPPPETKNPA